jgi:hypothetical protein
MLVLADLNALVEVVTARLDEPRLEMHVAACGHRVNAITVPAVWPVLARAVLARADLDQWLLALLDSFEGEPGAAPALVAACRTARAQWASAVRAIEPQAPAGRRDQALVLFNRAPFIDRAPARPLIGEAVHLAGRRVLVVRGRDGVGKSHLGYFVRHMVEASPGTRMALVRLNELDADRVRARELMEALATSMGLDVNPAWDQQAQDARQADKLARWLVGRLNGAAGSGVRWVIVIDELDHPKVAPGAVDLVNRLVQAAARGDLVDTALVVIALPGEVPPGVAADVMEHELAPLTSTELRTHIVELARTLGVALTPEQLDILADFAQQGLQFPLDRAAMDTVRRRVAQLPEQIVQVST